MRQRCILSYLLQSLYVTLRATGRLLYDRILQARQLDSTIHGVLEMYELPDFVRLVGAEKKVRFED